MTDDKRTLDELIAELNQMRGRIDILRKLANALIQGDEKPEPLAGDFGEGEPPTG
jgi:hypothetical protein